jgi:hypothetical protein
MAKVANDARAVLLCDSFIAQRLNHSSCSVVVACLFFFADALINDASRRGGAERLSLALLNVTTTLFSF